MKAKELKKFLENLDEEEIVIRNYNFDECAMALMGQVEVMVMYYNDDEAEYFLNRENDEEKPVRCVVINRFRD